MRERASLHTHTVCIRLGPYPTVQSGLESRAEKMPAGVEHASGPLIVYLETFSPELPDEECLLKSKVWPLPIFENPKPLEFREENTESTKNTCKAIQERTGPIFL